MFNQNYKSQKVNLFSKFLPYFMPSYWQVINVSLNLVNLSAVKALLLLFLLTSAYAHDLHQMSGDAIDEPLDLCVSLCCFIVYLSSYMLEDLLHVSSTGTIYSHVSDPSSYVLPQNTYENYPFSIPIGYDYLIYLLSRTIPQSDLPKYYSNCSLYTTKYNAET